MTEKRILWQGPCGELCPVSKAIDADESINPELSRLGWPVSRAVQILAEADGAMEVYDFVKNWPHLTTDEAHAVADCAHQIIAEGCESEHTTDTNKRVKLFPNGDFSYAGVHFDADDTENMRRLDAGVLPPYWQTAYRDYYNLSENSVVKINDQSL